MKIVNAYVNNNEDGKPTLFANFGLDNKTIDDYFNDEGDKIADMCGTTPSQMDYEWKWMHSSHTMALRD